MILIDLCGTEFRKQWQGARQHLHNGGPCLERPRTGTGLTFSPLIIAKVSIRKLFQKGSFYYPFGCFILEKVDKDMLKARVTVRGGGLFGKLIEPGVFFMKCLLETELGSREGNTVDLSTCMETDTKMPEDLSLIHARLRTTCRETAM